MTWRCKMSNRIRITVEINETLQKGIENAIKNNYPKLKTVSDVVREALKRFLKESEGND
jgi:metal-responsive CopG/Arc/MetJ family transcriptional regulator